VRDGQREAHNWKTKFEDLSDDQADLDGVINYMTPRPDWEKVGQYASGETDGKSSAELVEGLYLTIDELRGLTGTARFPKRRFSPPQLCQLCQLMRGRECL
jgi:hypothetical protein